MMTEPSRLARPPVPDILNAARNQSTSGRKAMSIRGNRPRASGKKRRTPSLERLLRERATILLKRRDEVQGKGDAEAVHDLRVATRRLQEVLDLFEPVLPGKETRRVRRRARSIRHHFAEVRDKDVLHELVRALRPATPASQRAAVAALERTLRDQADDERRALAHTNGHAALQVKGIRKRLEALLERFGKQPARPALVARAARAGLARRMRELERARRAASSGRPLPAHRLRIAVKRWRYALEILDASNLGPFTGAIEAARRVQEKLGALHDLDVLLDLARRSPHTRALRPALAAKRRALWKESRPLVAAYGTVALRGLRGMPRRRGGASRRAEAAS
jgi:CHAD domain-containing protein